MNNNNNKIVLIIGGARSGKSRFAQEYATEIGGKVLFCATAEPLDDEMKTRIEIHKKTRPQNWSTLEASRHVGTSLLELVPDYDTVIIDCITMLVSNSLISGDSPEQTEPDLIDEISQLIVCMEQRQANYILVTNDVGSGLVPDNKLGRTYRDMLGRANQRLAGLADEAYLLVAGLPLKIK